MTTKEAESVVARLMGLDMRPVHNQQPIRRQHRVLSDRYIHKSASVGVRYGSLVSIRLSNRKFDEIPSGEKVVSGVAASEYKHDVSSKNCSSSISSKIQLGTCHQKPDSSSVTSRAGKKKAFFQKENRYTCKYDLRYLQKLKLEMSDNLCSGISSHASKFGSHSKSDDREFKQSLRHRHGKVHYGLAHRKLVSNNIVTPRRSCVVHNCTTNVTSQQVTCRSSSEDVSESGFVGEKYLKSKPDTSLWKKQDEYTWIYKLKSEDILEPQGGRDHEGFQFSLGGNGSVSQSSESSSSCFSGSGSGSGSEKYVQNVQDETSERCIGIELSQTQPESLISNPDFQHSTEDAVVNTEACKVDDSRISLDKDDQAKSDPNLSYEDAHASFHLQAPSMGESLSKELSGEESRNNPNFPKIGNSEFRNYLKITNQESPDSVLESLDIQNPSTFERFRSLGLLLQLQNLDFESEDETHSEEFKMFVSDDEDSTQQLDKFSQHEKTIGSWFRDDKSRYFSYMVNVLDEAGFCIGSHTWYSKESPISPLVFNSLEKKYGKQTSWLKSERHLLFDRINSALVEIVGPILEFEGCERSLKRWFSEAWMRDEVEDRLWMLLVNEEDEESGNLIEKALSGMGKWMDFGEDVGVICRELEGFLFDELVMEFVSLRD